MVVEIYGDPLLMNVWILEGSPGIRSRGEMVAAIDGLARSHGCKSWKFESPRKGWARMLRGYAVRVAEVYERKVPWVAVEMHKAEKPATTGTPRSGAIGVEPQEPTGEVAAGF